MSFISTKAQLLINVNKTINTVNSGYKLMKRKSIDRSYTTYGGNGCLTKEQYEKGMSLSRKMKNMSSW